MLKGIIKELSVNNLYQISEKLLIMQCISIGDIINFRKAKNHVKDAKSRLTAVLYHCHLRVTGFTAE